MLRWKGFSTGLVLLFSVVLISLACGLTNETSILLDWTRTPTAFQPMMSTPTQDIITAKFIAPSETRLPSTAVSTEQRGSMIISIDERLPEEISSAIQELLDANPPAASKPLEFNIGITDHTGIANWIYCVVAPFPTIEGNITLEDIQTIWAGGNPAAFGSSQFFLSPETAAVLIAWWGVPDANAFQIVDKTEILSKAWEKQPSIAIIPFEELDPLWKVISVEGINPIQNTFSPELYPLTLNVGVTSKDEDFKNYFPVFTNSDSNTTNRIPDKLTNVMLTGVTALVRATAYDMENKGITYPARDLGDLLRSADITHISNEVPFAEHCPFPDPYQVGVRFCSDPDYIELLDEIGTDVVELTGDHFADWGIDAMLLTLEMYSEKGWQIYGGGETAEQAKQPLMIEHNGNKIAFIGCNGKGPPFSQASETNPGSVFCDYGFIEAEIARLADEGYMTIVTYQHHEYYTYTVPEVMAKQFDRMAEAGAVVVSGSQAHHPHKFAFINGGFIHYGLGNMFFDQFAVGVETRQSFIDRHVFYDGKYISTELIPIQFVDFSRARLMTAAEANIILSILFPISEWNYP